MQPRDPKTGQFITASKAPSPGLDFVTASFDHGFGAGKLPIWHSPRGGPTLISQQKQRNNWYGMDIRGQMSGCRKVSDQNGLVRPVVDLRHASITAGFRLMSEGGEDPDAEYDFAGLVDDIIREDLTTDAVVALWRKDETNPVISILDAERCDYSSVGGIDRIRLRVPQDHAMAKDKALKNAYIERLGQRMYDAYCGGKVIDIVRGHDEDWDFRVMTSGKRRGCFRTPELVGILETIDFLELMGVGDWNLAWFRKDVIRLIKKGYKGTGQHAMTGSVDLTKPQEEQLGKGFSSLSGNANVPANHDVDASYLTMDPSNFDPAQVKAAIDRFLMWAGIEGVILLGSFSQQNGAAPSLMRNHRTMVFSKRTRVERFLREILAADEFQGLVDDPAKQRFGWSVKSLYSVDEIAKLVTATADGIASPQTRRQWLDLDDRVESELMRKAHANREDYTPPFEARQGLLKVDGSDPGGGGGEPGRPEEITE